ncbi:MAG TPA: SDR family NAD(P)-dependent oxidoreductase [Candidatus Eisenbacteria bacterium]|nr:SDR family NAD(P)-dependent oxidoreductase [Candidatus Eisenbacteria bacterium]
MSGRLAGKVALVTGASRGIGRALGRCFGAEGGAVALAARSAPDLAEAAREVEAAGGRALAIAGDVSDPDQAGRMVSETVDKLGRLDILVNNAGVGCRGRIDELAIADWDRVFAVNLRGVFLVTRAAVPVMKERGGGHIVNIASVAGLVANPGISAYNATKFGLMGFSESLMLELRHDHIKVSVICPGSTDTHFGSGPQGGPGKENFLSADDVADAVLDLVTTSSNALISQVHLRPLIPPRR